MSKRDEMQRMIDAARRGEPVKDCVDRYMVWALAEIEKLSEPERTQCLAEAPQAREYLVEMLTRDTSTIPSIQSRIERAQAALPAGKSGFTADYLDPRERAAMVADQLAADELVNARSGGKVHRADGARRDGMRLDMARLYANIGRKYGTDHQGILDGIWEHMKSLPPERAEIAAVMMGDTLQQSHMIFCSTWGASGFPTVVIEAASWARMSATDTIAEEIVSQLRHPWPAFLIKLPHGVIRAEDGEWIDRICVATGNDLGQGETWTILAETARIAMERTDQLPVELCSEFDEGEGTWKGTAIDAHALSQRDERVLRLLGKLVVASVLELDRSGGGRRRLAGKSRRATKAELATPSASLEYVIGEPVIVDVRPYIDEYLSGKRGTRGPKKTRVLVRGHWKNQPHGPGRTLRKFIHIDPYWSVLDESLPIAVRPHVLKEPKRADGNDGESGAPPQAAE